MIDVRPASGSLGLQSSADAREYLMESFRAQLEQSEEQKAPPNTSIEGDAGAKAAFAVLLLQEQQRAFFLQLVRDRRFWPRLRSLVGAPPYGFLLPEDEGLLNASGIAKHRSHLAPTVATMSNLGDFGCGHFRDEAQRLYRVVAKRGASDADLPWRGLRTGQRVVVDVRLRLNARGIRLALAGGGTVPVRREELVFPRPGDVVHLEVVPQLRKWAEGAHACTARVELGKQKGMLATIARLVLKIE